MIRQIMQEWAIYALCLALIAVCAFQDAFK